MLNRGSKYSEAPAFQDLKEPSLFLLINGGYVRRQHQSNNKLRQYDILAFPVVLLGVATSSYSWDFSNTLSSDIIELLMYLLFLWRGT
jgi:hypothetical protein